MKLLAVVIIFIVKESKILLIKRNRGNFSGLLAIPGGKIEADEFIHEAAEREAKEESGITCRFREHLGVVSEQLIENGEQTFQFTLHCCLLRPDSTETKSSEEGEIRWYDLNKLDQFRDDLIPSDYFMIKELIIKKKKGYYISVLEKKDNIYIQKEFEKIPKDQ